jgi:hypothetical protein
MKNYLLLVALMVLSFGCTRQDPEADKAGAEAAVKGFYAAFEKFDYPSMRTFCTSDFHAIEGETAFNNMDEFIAMAKTFEGSSMQVQMDFIKADVVKDMAVVLFKFDVTMKKDKNEMNMKGYESHMLKKIDGKWLIGFYQCTYLNSAPRIEKGNLLGMHIFEKMKLQPGVTMEQAEDFFINKYIPAVNKGNKDFQMFTVKSLRGDYKDKFGILFYLNSEEKRNSIWKDDGSLTEKGNQIFDNFKDVYAEWGKYFILEKTISNDWLVK